MGIMDNEVGIETSTSIYISTTETFILDSEEELAAYTSNTDLENRIAEQVRATIKENLHIMPPTIYVSVLKREGKAVKVHIKGSALGRNNIYQAQVFI